MTEMIPLRRRMIEDMTVRNLSPATQRSASDLVTAEELAVTLASQEAGYIVQRRMKVHPRLRTLFGPFLWSVRVLVLLTATGPIIHRAVAKIATGQNPADNFWRRGNVIGTIHRTTGQVKRVIKGTGADMALNPLHPDTGRAIIGTVIPEWDSLAALVKDTSRLLPAIRTQSWDIAVTDEGPIPLEVNFGGDLTSPNWRPARVFWMRPTSRT